MLFSPKTYKFTSKQVLGQLRLILNLFEQLAPRKMLSGTVSTCMLTSFEQEEHTNLIIYGPPGVNSISHFALSPGLTRSSINADILWQNSVNTR